MPAAMRSLCLLLTAVAMPALAHDLWLEREAGGYVLYQGHRHSAHAGTDVVPYEAAAAKGGVCLGDAGERRPVTAAKGYPARYGGDCAALLVAFSTGYWTKTPWETKNLPKPQVPGALRSWLSEETLKRVDRWTPALTAPLGDGLELSPMTNPLVLAPGEKLVVRVTENRKPKAGVPVAYQGDTRGATGEDGTVAIRIRRTGTQLISASVETPLADGNADVTIRATALQFEVAP